MSRTWRNRKTIPKGLKMREGVSWAAYDSNGREYYFDTHTHTEIVYRRPNVFNSYWGYTIIKPSILEKWKMEMLGNNKIPMERRYVKQFRKPLYSKETKTWRKINRGRKRARERDLIIQGRWDDIPRETGTCGWNSW